MPRFRPVAGLASAAIFLWAGFAMMSIRSVSGDSIAEAFYQAFGLFSLGFVGLSLIAGFVPLTVDDARQGSAEFKRCVECQEYIWKTATTCPACRTDLIAEEEATRRRSSGSTNDGRE